jgi:ribonuclease J
VLLRDLRGRVAVTCFASNVARLESVAIAAHDAGRSVALVGRSLRNIDAAARECGYLRDLPPFLTEDDVDDVPDDNILMMVTGSQGEPRSALARIALDTHPRVALGQGDTVIFSSRMIPGNERAIVTVQDNLVRRGVNLMTDADHMVHVSGHPARDELRRLYRLVKPRFSVPTHGEWRHLSAHAALARDAGAQPILLEDGDVLSLSPERAEVTDSAPVDKLVLDGSRLTPIGGGVMTARRRMLFNGVVLYVLIWWTALFAVLPIGTRPVEDADEATGWRGAPQKPQLLRKVIITTVVAAVVWFGAWLLITSPYVSFRHGWFAAPQD